MISVLNYGLGNLGSIMNMLKHVRIPAKLISTPSEIYEASSILLPGVGSFDAGMKTLQDRNLIPALNEIALIKRIPVLGICLGAQLLMDSSEEGTEKGLGWIKGNVLHFTGKSEFVSRSLRVPHMGWSPIESKNALFRNMDEDMRFYFVHSYYLNPAIEEDVLCTAQYGGKFVAGVHKNNVTGVQFHPEKSHQYGMQFFKNYYAEITKS